MWPPREQLLQAMIARGLNDLVEMMVDAGF
jgi:hypothetical protein